MPFVPFTKPTLRIALSCCSLLSLAVMVAADPTDDARKSIQAVYDRISAAVDKKDVSAATIHYTPDFDMVDRNGIRNNLAANRQQLQALFSMLKNIKATQTIQSLSLKGNQAMVTEHTHLEGIAIDPRSKKACKFVGDNISLDTWVKGPKGWMQKRSKTLNERTTIDGKPQS
jgi:ketosteroid isomerase-like protein